MGASTAGERGGREPAAGAMSAIGEVAKQLQSNYRETTPKRLRMLDMFLLFVFTTGVLQVMEASDNGGVVRGRSLERCFAEYVVCNMVLFLVVMNFMG
ncbi:Oligosaccharyltransferase, DAD1 subunit (or epsilon subunit) [Ectocarpus siliculosus]|uniref:Dolichyl-diphosphooligosaccharide--protein glycosyltransferase subunit OST2 n=1 Tax=Ectocarpus siliculosus TaxID=2880 RepID=D7G1T4_ECTSI|nr:Oligosaccharyltransferase, DAD1 subunit (or epsilon subunit) [Ectocarpus siliculosus]|eukprot:CBJ48660.1 Oligosaccharyltransferase, DAD1 subunit (or epsilon subunit) [Ectocarpus siliculosus]